VERLVPIGRFLFRFRGWIFPVVVVLALLLSRPRHLLGDAGLDRWMDLAGSIVALLGLAVRAVTIGYEYIVRGGRNRQVYADDLVQGGIYALTCNPMYLGNGLLVIGCALILNAPAFYLVAVPVILCVCCDHHCRGIVPAQKFGDVRRVLCPRQSDCPPACGVSASSCRDAIQLAASGREGIQHVLLGRRPDRRLVLSR
jgi:protein-S-isoprenylcysteine O-methyltransferase Ste14